MSGLQRHDRRPHRSSEPELVAERPSGRPIASRFSLYRMSGISVAVWFAQSGRGFCYDTLQRGMGWPWSQSSFAELAAVRPTTTERRNIPAQPLPLPSARQCRARATGGGRQTAMPRAKSRRLILRTGASANVDLRAGGPKGTASVKVFSSAGDRTPASVSRRLPKLKALRLRTAHLTDAGCNSLPVRPRSKSLTSARPVLATRESRILRLNSWKS